MVKLSWSVVVCNVFAVMTMCVTKHQQQRQQHLMTPVSHAVYIHQTVMRHVGLLIYPPWSVQMLPAQ